MHAAKVLHLLPVTFEMTANPSLKEYGFIAQDVLPLFADLVKEGTDPSKTFSLNYIGMIAPIVRAVQEVEALRQNDLTAQQKENAALRIQLKAANDNLVSEATALRAQVNAANDNYLLLRREIEGLKRAMGR